MKIINHTFSNNNLLKYFIKNNNIKNSNQTLIQIFYSVVGDITSIVKIKNALLDILPNATIMGITTSGIVSDGAVFEDFAAGRF